MTSTIAASSGGTPTMVPSTPQDEDGFTLVFFALAIVALLGIAALVVDVGSWYLEGQKVQRAADAAALAGVVWMPSNPGNATTTALQAAAGNGFTSGVNVNTCVPDPSGGCEKHELAVSITDKDVPTFFAKIFGMDKITETRASTAEYQPSIPLGSAENSFGTGGLSLDAAGDTSNIWAAVNGYCTSKENGDEFLSAFDGTYDALAKPPDYQCSGTPNADLAVTGASNAGTAVTLDFASGPTLHTSASIIVAGATGTWTSINGTWTVTSATATSVTFTVSSAPTGSISGTVTIGGDPNATDNYEYNGGDGATAGYSYDIVTPSAETLGFTTAPIFVQAYDPAYEPTQCSGQPQITTTTPFNPAGGQTVDTSLGAGTTNITTDYTLTYSPIPLDPSAFDQPMPNAGTFNSEPYNSEGANPYVATSGDTATCGQWTNLFVIPAGSQDGDYRLQVTTPYTHGQNADGSNSYSLRVWEGATGSTWSRCSTITTDTLFYSDTCPVIQGQNALSVYATQSAGISTATCPSNAPAGATCGSFYLAQIDQSYAGDILRVNLFDPGEGDKDIELLNNDGTPVDFSWNVTDDCPLAPPNAASTDCAQDLGFTDNAGDSSGPTPKSELPVDGTVNPPTGIVSPSEFNDRHVQLTFGIPDDYTGTDNGGWWKIEYVSQGPSVSITDRTTWTVDLGGSPIHLLPPTA